MSNPFVIATHSVTRADLASARLGPRFGRMDLTSQLSLAAVEPLSLFFESSSRDRIAIVLAARASSLPTDLTYWDGRDAPGGLSPTLFTYTLPSAAIGELAIRHRLRGPNLCFVGAGEEVLNEGAGLIKTAEADACLCVLVQVISAALTQRIALPECARADAVFLQRTGPGLLELGENHRDMESLCANLRAHN